uniref:Reverse transcriptase Ty1/copia-type domain-containing protein n=1 Tax=Solanum lycopersicum TaxID=4081 RepID=A0A3Q7EAP7_SOLLC
MDGELLTDPSEYRSMVGALQYLTMTRPNIFYVVNVVSQFMHDPHTTHMHCVKRIFRYLSGTLTYGLTLRTASPTSMVIAYSDAGWFNQRFQNHLKRLNIGLLHTLLLRLVGFATSFVSLMKEKQTSEAWTSNSLLYHLWCKCTQMYSCSSQHPHQDQHLQNPVESPCLCQYKVKYWMYLSDISEATSQLPNALSQGSPCTC